MAITAPAWYVVWALAYPFLPKYMAQYADYAQKSFSHAKTAAIYFGLSGALYYIIPAGFEDVQFLIAMPLSILAILSIIDGYTQYIPDHLSLALALMGLGANTIGFNAFDHPIQSCLAAMIAYAMLTSFAALYERISGVDGMGKGDVKLYAALACWFGFDGLLPILFIANLLFLIYALAMRQLKSQEQIAFGPFLAIAAVLLFIATNSKALAPWLAFISPLQY